MEYGDTAFKAKTFDELTNRELYEILRVRSEIFVVEQECVFQDMDGADYEALHIFCEEDGQVLAYMRAYPRGPEEVGRAAAYRHEGEPAGETGCVQMGRVLTKVHGTGLGGRLLTEGGRLIRERFDPDAIYNEAQLYAHGYYARAGFRPISDTFDEDGIPHGEMMLRFR